VNRVTNRRRMLMTSLAVAGLLAGSGGAADPVAASATQFEPWSFVRLGAQLIGRITPSALDKDGNGRVTVMVVGSDYRAQTAGTGERTDMMMLLTVRNQVISAASLPRDVGNVPICNGAIYKPKINGLFKYYKQTYGSRNEALEHMRTAFECTFKIKIDYVVYLRFTAVDRLTDEVGGFTVSVPRDYLDKSINDERTSEPMGAKFLQDNSVLMKGTTAPDCYTVRNSDNTVNWAASPNCTRLLLYGRTRHGAGNNDWVRAKRQQNIFFSALQRVLSRGSGSNLTSLRSSALSSSVDFYTDMPSSTTDAVAWFNLLDGSTMPNQVVFKPSKWAFTVQGTSKQQLKIDVVRARMADWFGSI
jgi:anionic cell wall polymer biosynthesis LytR-Cps2A-Psr (LCP) family protein